MNPQLVSSIRMMAFDEIVPVLQLAIGPVILISGVGLLLLSMTNRFGRVIDRSRQLRREYSQSPIEDRDRVKAQLDILKRRARIVRAAIFLAALSALLAALLVVNLFVAALLQWNLAPLIVLLFIGCLFSLIGALTYFISDINVSLKALWLETTLPDEPFTRK